MTPDGAHARRREQQIRAILAAHADQVAPAGGLEEIRSRIAARRPWWRRAWDRLTAHAHDWRGDPVCPDDVRCRICGRRPCKNGAPGVEPGAPSDPTAAKEPKDMTIIPRKAREVRAGDIITRDPDHGGMPVRWRVTRRPQVTADDVAIIDYTDISDEPRAGIAHFDALTELAVEPAGGAQ